MSGPNIFPFIPVWSSGGTVVVSQIRNSLDKHDEKGKSLHITIYKSDMKKSKQKDVGAHKAVAHLYAGSASKSCHTGGSSIK